MLGRGLATTRGRVAVVCIAALTLAVAGCGGEDDEGATTTETAAAEVDFAAFQDCVEGDPAVGGVSPGPTSVDSVAAEAGEGAFQLHWPNGDYANVAVETTSDDATATVEEYESGATVLSEIDSYGSVVVASSTKPSPKQSGLIADCAEEASASAAG